MEAPPALAEVFARHRLRLTLASDYYRQGSRAADCFYDWCRRSVSGLRFYNIPPEEALDFWVTSRSVCVGARTAEKDLQFGRVFGFRPDNEDAARLRIRRAQYANAVKRLSAGEEFSREKTYPPVAALMSLLEPRPEDTDHEREMQAFWYLCVATGNRPHNILEAISCRVEADLLRVRWGRRKVAPIRRQPSDYPFHWSGPPPLHVRTTLLAVARRRRSSKRAVKCGWSLHPHKKDRELATEFNVASSICAWLKRRAENGSEFWTSTTGRDVLTSLVLPLVGTDPHVPTAETYFILFDHHEHTARANYVKAAGRPVDEHGRPASEEDPQE